MTGAPSFRERLVFHEEHGALMDETRRYMLIRPDALMGMLRRLPEELRLQAFEALAESIFEQGSDSAQAYQAMGAHDAAALLGTVAATAPHLGWGRWRFDLGEESLRVTVENSPFAAGYGASPTPVCYPIVGMLRAVSTMVFGRATTAEEVACAACGAQNCHFEARVVEDETLSPPPRGEGLGVGGGEERIAMRSHHDVSGADGTSPPLPAPSPTPGPSARGGGEMRGGE